MSTTRNIWGTPNKGPHGQILVESNCRTCYFFEHTGMVLDTMTLAEGCSLQVKDFPNTKVCVYYSREPGSDC